MSAPLMITHLLLERFARQLLPRIPETHAVMEAPNQIGAFLQSGRDDGVLAYLYFFHAVMSLPVIRPGDTVLDLACGPATQLTQIARLNPHTQFIGVDASHKMLELARTTLTSAQIDNVKLQFGDITQLDTITTASIDCVLCTMSLHHLPDVAALNKTMREIRRVLKPDGGIYVADFGRLKRAATQKFFAHDRADSQSEQFTHDFLQSMRAAFSVSELSAAAFELDITLSQYATALAPFLFIFRSAARRPMDANLSAKVAENYRHLTRVQQRDFDNIARWFRLGGLTLPCDVNFADDESAQRSPIPSTTKRANSVPALSKQAQQIPAQE
jgi:arsenite methyltransferase